MTQKAYLVDVLANAANIDTSIARRAILVGLVRVHNIVTEDPATVLKNEPTIIEYFNGHRAERYLYNPAKPEKLLARLMTDIKIGDRVRLLRPMFNPDSARQPVERGMSAGLEGTVTHVSLVGPDHWHQIGVQWDNGRNLNLLHGDHYEVLPPPAPEEKPAEQSE